MLSIGTKKTYESLLKSNWEILSNTKIEFSPKNLFILKLYFALMGKKYHVYFNKAFIPLIRHFFELHKDDLCISSNNSLARAMNPETAFDFGAENVEKLRTLLLSVKAEAAVLTESKSEYLFEVLAMVVNEGLHFAQVMQDKKEYHTEEAVQVLEKKMRRIKKLAIIIHCK